MPGAHTLYVTTMARYKEAQSG